MPALDEWVDSPPVDAAPPSVKIPEQVGGRPGQQLAFKNNNPGNIEYAHQPGAELGEDGRFARFPTPEAGLADVHRVIGLHQNDTIEKYLTAYAPPSENDTAAYVANAAKVLGVSKDTQVSKIDRDKLAAFQAKQESGATVSAPKDEWIDAPVSAAPQPADDDKWIDAPAPAPSLLERGKALLDQVKGVGSQIVGAAQKPGLGFAQPGVGKEVVGPWKEAAKDLVQEATGPLENVPGGPWLRRALHEAIDKGGDAAAGALEFVTSPLGIATAPLAAEEGLVGGATRSVMSGSQAPQAVQAVRTAVQQPTPENVAGAAVSTVGAALPMAPELAAGAGKVVQAGTEAAGALERHNIEAERLVEAERQKGLGTETGQQILGGDMQVKIGDQTVTVRAAGGSDTGRPFYQVLGPDGKPVFAGFGQNVQEYLRQQGARPLNEPAPARYPNAQPTGTLADQNEPSARAQAPPASIPAEGPSEDVQRAVDARDRLAQDLAGKPFKDLSNPERLVVDHFVSQGYGFAVQPGEGGIPPDQRQGTAESAAPPAAIPPVAPPQQSGIPPAQPSPVQAAAAPATSPEDFDGWITDERGEPLMQAGTEAPEGVIPETIPRNVDREPYPPLKPLRTVEQEAADAGQHPGEPGIYQGGRRVGDIPQAVESPSGAVQEIKQAAPSSVEKGDLVKREPSVPLATGEQTSIQVPGEKTAYPARYAVIEASDLQASHNPQSFEANPAYQHQNDRDYSQVENAARVVNAAQDFRPEFVLTKSPTAELGTTIVDQNGNALGGNNRAMALQRVYQSGNPQAADEYKTELLKNSKRFGIDPEEIGRFRQPILVRQVSQPLDATAAQNAITDFNKTSSAALNPGEQAVADGRRLSIAALKTITGSLDDLGEEGTLSQALRGDNGQEILAKLVKDGVITDQEKNGYLDERGQLTPEIKDRIAKALVGRLFKSPKELQRTTPETRAKLERIAPQLLRVEDRKGWELTEPTKEALVYLEEIRARGGRAIHVNVAEGAKPLRALANAGLFDAAKIPGLIEQEGKKKGQLTAEGKATAERLFRENQDSELLQSELTKSPSEYSPVAKAIARKLQEGPLAAARAFRMYANDEAMSREGAQTSLYEPPTQQEAFDSAFGPIERGKAKAGTKAAISETEPADTDTPGLFSDTSGSAKLSTLTLGLDKFVEQDIAPTVQEAARTVAQASDDVLKILLPTARGGKSTKLAALVLRNRLAELARQSDRAEAALATARKYFEKQGDAGGRDFILKYFSDENAPLPQTGDKNLDGIARVLRNLLDGRRDEVQSLGSGKLGKFYTNYFPRVWKDWRKAEGMFASFYGRRPLEGGKGFLKQRKHVTIEDALNAGLEPVSWNPIDLVLLKVREMDRYLMAHRVLEDWKGSGIVRYIDAREGKAPAGWQKIADPIGTIYGPSVQQIKEYPNDQLYQGLQKVVEALDLTHVRGFKNLRDAVGRAHQGTGKVETMHGSAEQVLAHEIGHQIDWLAGSGKRFVVNYPSVESVARIREARKTLGDPASGPEARKAANQTLRQMKPDIQKRKQFQGELRALADLRLGGQRTAYTHKREEKMALLAEMWVGARELFQKTAPMVFDEWKRFLDETPKLEALRDIQAGADVSGISQPYDVGGIVTRGHWWAPEGAARILNNYLSPSLRTTSGAYKAILGANNVLNQFQLGLSAFHLGFTSADAAISKASLGFEAAMRGKPVTAAKAFAAVPAAPFTTMIQGNKLLREWYKPGSEGAWIGKLVDGLVAAGGRARMDEIYGTKIADRMTHAFRNGNIWGGLIRAPFAGVEQISNVLMREIVPRQKLGVFADMARFELERLGPEATFEQTREVLTQAWDSVENRMGQMTYDNLFWNRTAKDIAMIGVRSVGWNLGTIREIGGGAADLVRVPLQIAGGKPPGEVNLKRISYLMGLVTVSAIMGAIYQYLRTGKGPEEAKDLFFPKTGQLDAAGRPDRAALPTYVKDVYHYATEPVKTLANKIAPIWSLVAEMVRNEDFYNTEIRGADDPLVEQMKQVAEYGARTAEPFGIRNYERDVQMQNPTIDKAQRFIGIVPAPSAIEKTKAERLASELSREHIPAGSRTHQEAARRDAEQTIARLAKSGKDYADQARDYVQSGVLTAKDAHAAAIRSQVSPLLRTARSLPLQDLLDVWKVATPDEKDELRPLLGRHLKTLRDLPIAQREQLTPRLQAALTQ